MSKLTRQQFILMVAPEAVKDMKKSKVPASLTIAQAILESADGNSLLAKDYNNIFGIKGKGPAGTILLSTTEYIKGKVTTVKDNFRVYNNWGESIADHSALFAKGTSWNPNLYRSIIGVDGITAANEVGRAGYATDPNYSKKLITLINDYALQLYDRPQTAPSIEALEYRIKELENKLTPISIPEWLSKAYPTQAKLLEDKTGSLEFWRAIGLSLQCFYQK